MLSAGSSIDDHFRGVKQIQTAFLPSGGQFSPELACGQLEALLNCERGLSQKIKTGANNKP